ncbi:hypothetical protein B4U80_00084 [Leptotrombidium deliense]|uniref:Uncharacterized protein n=1 Tax=Leptotrombidium deliense TaxID=299467 RepID=A0A443SJU4_9ACAR|nr:hypothetical protein B4U80_00084 [Leptotrombidium deliense]
MAKIIGRKHF